jgi:hypothetical protein
MKRKIAKDKLPFLAQHLIDYVDSKSYNYHYMMLRDFMKDARVEYYHQLIFEKENDAIRKAYIKIIRGVDYWNIEKTTYEQRWMYTHFAEHLDYALDLDFNKNRKAHKMERQVSPPIEAYGEKEKFKPTGRDFGLLFE